MSTEEKIIQAVKSALSKGDKVLIIPVKDGKVRLFRFERREIKVK